MARESRITRTIERATIEIMVCDTSKAIVEVQSFTFYGDDTQDPLQTAKRVLPADLVPVAVKSLVKDEVLAVMSEKEFLRHCEILPARGSK